jgi:hypothetical protein
VGIKSRAQSLYDELTMYFISGVCIKMLNLLLSFVLIITAMLLVYFRIKMRHILKFSEMIPGPKTLPILGNAFDFGFRTEGEYAN